MVGQFDLNDYQNEFNDLVERKGFLTAIRTFWNRHNIIKFYEACLIYAFSMFILAGNLYLNSGIGKSIMLAIWAMITMTITLKIVKMYGVKR